MKKRILLPIFFLLIATGSSGFYLSYKHLEGLESPAKIVSVSAKLGGDSGSMITVQYQTDKNMSRNYESNETYLVLQDSGKKLGVQWTEYFGPLASQSKGKMTGWFIIDNSERDVRNGTMVTIVIGSFTKENYAVTDQP
jgi:hypothetical protein